MRTHAHAHVVLVLAPALADETNAAHEKRINQGVDCMYSCLAKTFAGGRGTIALHRIDSTALDAPTRLDLGLATTVSFGTHCT